MTHIPEEARARFEKLAGKLAKGDAGRSPHRDGMGTGSLFVGRKMFGILDDSGGLILKLSPDRIQELIASGVGAGWHPGAGKPLKEYVLGGVRHESKWLALAKESREYMAEKV